MGPMIGKGRRGSSKLWNVARGAWRLLLVAALVWVAGDFAYSRWVEQRLAQWEKTVQRGPDGLRPECAAFSLGNGKTALLMVHGFGDSPALFSPMAAALAKRGYTCRAMRLPDSGIPRRLAASVTFEDQLHALASELAALRTRHRAVWVIGHSTGGTLAIRQALDDPSSVDGLILLAPLLGVSDRRSPIFPARSWFHLLERTLMFSRMAQNAFPLDVHDPAARAFSARDSFMPMELYRELFRAIDAVRDRAPELRTPALFLLSEADRVTDPLAAEAFAAQCAGPRTVVKHLPRSGHVIPLDYDQPAVVNETDRFIRGDK